MAVTIGQVIALIKALGGKGGGGGGGGVSDVKVNGISVVENGVAKIPVADNSTIGAVRVLDGDHGLQVTSTMIQILKANDNDIKNAATNYRPITPTQQHKSVFFGLATASGNSDQASSNNAVGIYTEDAKSKISDMLTAPENVSGTTPSISAKAGVRYVCGECASLDIAAPASGCIDVLFESGSTPTVLTITTAKSGVTDVKFPAWFDPDDLDADTTYEINILDGEFGAVSAWA